MLTLEQVAAHIEIQQVLFRYCRGVDRGDKELIRSVYHDEAIDDHGAYVGRGKDFPEDVVPRMDKAGVIGQHRITNVYVEFDSATKARVESYFFALNPEIDPVTKKGRLSQVYGRYLDQFEMRNGDWLVAARKIIIDHVTEPSPSETWERASVFTWGARREADKSHALFSNGK